MFVRGGVAFSCLDPSQITAVCSVFKNKFMARTKTKRAKAKKHRRRRPAPVQAAQPVQIAQAEALEDIGDRISDAGADAAKSRLPTPPNDELDIKRRAIILCGDGIGGMSHKLALPDEKLGVKIVMPSGRTIGGMSRKMNTSYTGENNRVPMDLLFPPHDEGKRSWRLRPDIDTLNVSTSDISKDVANVIIGDCEDEK